MEGSFAQAANAHHFKRARWRGLGRQQIQDWLIAAAQNLRLLVRSLATQRPAPKTKKSTGSDTAIKGLTAAFCSIIRAVQRAHSPWAAFMTFQSAS